MFNDPASEMFERGKGFGRARDPVLAQGVSNLEDLGIGKTIGCEQAALDRKSVV